MPVKSTCLGKDPKQGLSECPDTLELLQSLGRGEADGYVFPSPRGEGTSLDKRLEMFAESGDEPQGSTFTRTN